MFILRWMSLATVLCSFLASTAHAINTGGDFNNRTNFRPANPAVRIVTRTGQHDYAPTIMKDVDGKYKMWWCASNWNGQQAGGDQIYYSEATSLSGTWSTPISVFRASQYMGGQATDWDGEQTCDPSVIRVNGTYYLYYGGINHQPGAQTLIGVASSPTGLPGSWTRLNGGNPIITTLDSSKTVPPFYGVGHPAAVYLDGWFYLYFDDDTAGSSPYSEGYLYRSTDPTFPATSATQELLNVGGTVGFYSLSSARYSPWNTANADFMYHTGLNQFVLVTSSNLTEQTGIFFKREFQPVSNPYPALNSLGFTDIPGDWYEGPAVVRSPFGHSLLYSANISSSQCVVPLDVIRTEGDPSDPYDSTAWDLAWSGMDVTFNQRCGDIVTSTPFDVDADRISDPVVYRPSPGNMTFYRKNSTLTFSTNTLGTNDFIPVHGDFDGDGIDDFGGIDPDSSNYYNWSVKLSSTGGTMSIPTWGLVGDQIAIADYDGDGKDDAAVYRDIAGVFYVWQSSNGLGVAYGYGGPLERAVPADFDLDGKADRVVWYPNGVWNFQYSSGIPDTPMGWGTAGDITFAADYLGGANGRGDGYPDLVFWRPSTGTWYVRSYISGPADEIVQWGLPGDVPLIGDFNGDGNYDFTVWRPSNGTWYHNFRNGNTLAVQWGLSTDLIPQK